MTPTVYLIAQPTVKKDGKLPNLEPLEYHGKVRIILPGTSKPSRTPATTLTELEDALEHFDPARDFIAWAGGDTLAALMVGVVLERMEIMTFNWLRYDRMRLASGAWTDEGAHYRPVLITLFTDFPHDRTA